MSQMNLILGPEDAHDVPVTPEIRKDRLYPLFTKWLGDNRVPWNVNYPRLWMKFLEWHAKRQKNAEPASRRGDAGTGRG